MSKKELQLINEIKELSFKDLKDFVEENNDVIIQLDLEESKEKLNALSEKYSEISIDRENYKSDGKDAERELRETRYALQRIKNSNGKVFTELKKENGKKFDDLIAINQPLEERLTSELKTVKDKVKEEKEAKEKAEQERIKKIEKSLNEVQFSLEKIIASAKKDEDLVDYNKSIEELQESFSEFEDFEFEAKRLASVYIGRRKEVEAKIKAEKEAEKERETLRKQVEANKKAEQERLKIEAEKKAKIEEENRKKLEAENKAKEKILSHRKNVLEKRGLKDTGSVFGLKETDLSINYEAIKSLDEIDWFEFLEKVEEAKTKLLKDKEEKAKKEKLTIQNQYNTALKELEGLGGDIGRFSCKDCETHELKENLADLKQECEKLKIQKDEKEKKEIISDLKFFEDTINDFMLDLIEKADDKKFKNKESKNIVQEHLELLKSTNKNFYDGYVK